MNNKVFSYGKWICPKCFKELEHLDVLQMQKDDIKIDLPDELKNLHVIFRRKFNITEKNKPVTIKITADDYYKLYINKKYVGQGPAQGYYFSYYLNEYDITGFLSEGENEITAEVYYHGLISRSFNSGDNRMGMIAEVLSDEDCILSTDENFEYAVEKKYCNTHIIGADTAFAENIDSRKDKKLVWEKSVVIENDYIFCSKPIDSVMVYKKCPQVVKKLNNNRIFLDFGQELTGSLYIMATGKSGGQIRILSAEEADADQENIRYHLRCNCCYEENWIIDGTGEYEQYDYKGFRYVILEPEDGIDIEEVYANVRHWKFDDNYCKLESKSDVLNRVWDICKNGVKYGSQEVYVDCPTREKGQYAGDLTVTSAAHIALTGDLSLLKKAIDNQMQSSRYSKGLLAVTPGSYLQRIADYSLQFPILALRYFEYTGDMEYLAENLKVCEELIADFKRYAGKSGLLESVSDSWNLVDWPDFMRDNYDFSLDPLGAEPHNVINAFYIGCVMQTEQIRKILGVSAFEESHSLINAFNNEFLGEDGLYKDCKNTSHHSLHSNILPIYYGFVSENSVDVIGNFIESKGICCGVYMSYFLLKALCRIGRYQKALNLIVSQGEHSWFNMVREGATTCFEAWGKDQKWNTSLCHPWASAPISVLTEDILPNIPEAGKIVYNGKPPVKKYNLG